MKITKTFVFITLAACLAISMLAQPSAKNMKKLMNAEFAVSEFYVDSVKEDKLVEDAIRGMLEKLDPHSTYTTAEETKELTEPLHGAFSGIGVQFNMNRDTLYVISTVSGGPSERVGIIAGDRIIAVNDTSVAGVKMKTNEIRRRLMGPKGTLVRVMVKRQGKAEPLKFGITRDNIPIFSIDAAYMVDSKTGYVRISRFAESTPDEFNKALKKLQKQGMKQIIIDLTDNGGGFLQAVADLANHFLKAGQTIVFTQGVKSPRYDAKANGRGEFKEGKVVVLVNQNSASASEIFAGAIQDWDRGVIVGRRTFGKGLVQRPFAFEDGSMMRLTTARYYTPSGRCIQKPYKSGTRIDYEMDVYNRLKEGELSHSDSIHVTDSLKYSTLKTHRSIYGGGGIIPDVFVPIDTTEYSKYYGELNMKGVIIQYTIGYIDKNRNDIKKQYPSVEDFEKRFAVTPDMMKQLIAAGERDSVKFVEKDYNTSCRMLKLLIKSLIARDVYDQEAFTRIYNETNPMLEQALKVINDDRQYNQLLMRREVK
jgi:carboxyl-terminal processing protease